MAIHNIRDSAGAGPKTGNVCPVAAGRSAKTAQKNTKTPSIIRRRRDGNFSIIGNDVFNDTRLRAETLGVLAFLLSRPHDWNVYQWYLQERFQIGRDALQSIMRQLRELGYARIENERDPDTGMFKKRRYVIYDEPTVKVEPSPATTTPRAARNKNRHDNPDHAPENPSLGESRRLDNPTDGQSGRIIRMDRVKNTENYKTSLPEKRGRDESSAESASKQSKELFEQFRQAWPVDPTIIWSEAERVFFDLQPSDQADASRLAQRYIGYCQQHNRKTKFPENWLLKQGWLGFLKEERETTGAMQAAQMSPFVLEFSPAWEELKVHFAKLGKSMPSALDTKQGRGRCFDRADLHGFEGHLFWTPHSGAAQYS